MNPMQCVADHHTVLLRSDGSAVAFGSNIEGQCEIPSLPDGLTYTAVAAAGHHTVLLLSDGRCIACGSNDNGQCNIPPPDQGKSYVQIAAGNKHTVLLTNDGAAIAVGDSTYGQTSIPVLEEGLSYEQITAAMHTTILIRSDGKVVSCGDNSFGQCDIVCPVGKSIVQISAGDFHTLLLLSDGSAVAFGCNVMGQCFIPPLEDGLMYTQVAAGTYHSALLRSDNQVVHSGRKEFSVKGRRVTCEFVSAGRCSTVVILNDGSAVAAGYNTDRQCDIPPLPSGVRYIGGLLGHPDLALQIQCEEDGDEVSVVCLTMNGEHKLHQTESGDELVWTVYKRIAYNLNMNIQNLKICMSNGEETLAQMCSQNPGLTMKEILPLLRHKITKRKRVIDDDD